MTMVFSLGMMMIMADYVFAQFTPTDKTASLTFLFGALLSIVFSFIQFMIIRGKAHIQRALNTLNSLTIVIFIVSFLWMVAVSKNELIIVAGIGLITSSIADALYRSRPYIDCIEDYRNIWSKY